MFSLYVAVCRCGLSVLFPLTVLREWLKISYVMYILINVLRRMVGYVYLELSGHKSCTHTVDGLIDIVSMLVD